jgi:hypothetical protein
MLKNTPIIPHRQDDESRLRSQLEQLRARYDSGAVAPSMFAVIVDLETEIAWLQHLKVRP